MSFTGVYTALVSPFKNSDLDGKSFENLLQHQIEAGVQGFVINGTTAESPCLEWAEVEALFYAAKKIITKDQKLILGTGSNCTKKAIELNKKAESLGADAVLSVVPYYNKPTQEGLFQHFDQIAANCELPILLYNVPGRTITSMDLNCMQRLSSRKNIVGIKEAKGEPAFIEQIAKLCPEWNILSGDDGTYLESALGSCVGVISVISHLIPKEFVDWTMRARKGDLSVKSEFENYSKLCDLLFKEPNPIPVKYALKKMGIIASEEMRLPLVPCTQALQKEIDSELLRLGLCKS